MIDQWSTPPKPQSPLACTYLSYFPVKNHSGVAHNPMNSWGKIPKKQIQWRVFTKEGVAIRIKLSLLSSKWCSKVVLPFPCLRVSVATSKANKSADFGMMACGVISYHFMSARLRILPSQGVWHLQIYNYKPQQPRTTQQQPGYLSVCVFRQASRDLQASCTSLEFQEFSSGYFRSALKLIQQKLPLTEIWIWRKASIDSWTTGLYTPKANNPLQDVTQRDTHLPTTFKYV